jgi:hypothetical protein
MPCSRLVALAALFVTAFTRWDADEHSGWTPTKRAELATPVAAVAEGEGTLRSAAAASDGCLLLAGHADHAATRDCLRCHPADGGGNHPVDIPYDEAARRSRGSLRSTEEVVRRGLFLADGVLTCTTCHDPRSPWKFKIAIPPGAAVDPAVELGRPETYDSTPRRAGAVPPAGSTVSPKPLCTVCHTIGD